MAKSERARKIAYVVTSGSYSDYGIRAIFSSRKLAQAFIDRAKVLDDENNRGLADDEPDKPYIGDVYFASDANIEEWPMDEQKEAVLYSAWSVGIFLGTGALIEGPHESRRFGIPEARRPQVDPIPAYKEKVVVRTESLKSAKHAMKLAVELRQKKLREKTEEPHGKV